MRHTWVRYIAIALLAAMLLGLCGCELFANFNDGMTEEDRTYDPERAAKAEKNGNRWTWGTIGAVLIIFGIIGVAAPEGSWKMSYGWRFKDAEPSKAGLAFEQAAGIIALFVGGIMLLYTIVG